MQSSRISGRQVRARLRRNDQTFMDAHQDDTDEQLLDYVSAWAKTLGHSPSLMEIYGSALLLERFGSWHAVLALAGLPPIKKPPKDLKSCAIYQRELRKLQEERNKKQADPTPFD